MSELDLLRGVVVALGVAHKLARWPNPTEPGEREIGRLRTAFYREVWGEAAASVGGALREVHGSLLEVTCPGGRLRVRKNETSLDDPVTVALAADKALVLDLVARRGIPVPRHEVCRFDEVARAVRFARAVARPCVVKPARFGIGGLGVTTGVRRRDEFVSALAYARVYDPEVVVEELVVGGVYRLLYLDGELLDAVLRLPPCVVSDGTSTVDELVERENRRRLEQGIAAAQTLVKRDRELRSTLHEQGLRLGTVAPAGTVVRLKRVVNDNCREDNRAALASVCRAVADAGAEAAAAVGLRLAGVDIITPDPGRPLERAGGVVLEVNSGPGLYYHYMRAGPGVPVATLILERLAAASRRGSQVTGV